MATRKSAPRAPVSKAGNNSNADSPAASEPAGKGTVVPGTLHTASAAAVDVFTARPATSSSSGATATKTDSGATTKRDLSDRQQDMAEARDAGRLDPGNIRRPGASATPDLGSVERPGANRPPGPGTTSDSPFGDRAASRQDHEAEVDSPMDFGANPRAAAGVVTARGDDLRAATGRDGGLSGVAANLAPDLESGHGRPVGNDAVATVFRVSQNDPPELVKVKESPRPQEEEWVRWPSGPATRSEVTVNEDGSMAWTNEDGSTSTMDTDGNVVTTSTASGQPEEEIIIISDDNEDDEIIINPGPSEDGAVPLPPGWINGDLILPPSLRTGAAVAGAKGNDGVDWAHSRRAATNPSPEAAGGGGGTSGILGHQTKGSLIGNPGSAEGNRDMSGGGGVTQRGGATDPSDDQDTGRAKGIEEEPGDVQTGQTGDLSHLAGGTNDDGDTQSAVRRLYAGTLSYTSNQDDNDQDDD